MKSIYPKHIERRKFNDPNSSHARRWHEKALSFILAILFVLVVNWLIGCAQSGVRVYADPDCSEPAESHDFRCKVYKPEPDFVYDDAEEIDD